MKDSFGRATPDGTAIFEDHGPRVKSTLDLKGEEELAALDPGREGIPLRAVVLTEEQAEARRAWLEDADVYDAQLCALTGTRRLGQQKDDMLLLGAPDDAQDREIPMSSAMLEKLLEGEDAE